MNLNHLTIIEARKGLQEKKFSSVELTTACLERIDATEEKINALVTKTKDEALSQAQHADEELAKGHDLPLLGIPLVIKDNFCTKDVRTTASSKVLDTFIPPYDATVVTKLKSAGMVLLGKANMDAWAHGSSTETSDYGPSKNPWNTQHLPGGSSGGSAASVSAHQCVAAIGSETAGSIRQPASWCGITGLKPTYGRVSRYGVVAMASSFDSPGPMTKTVEDAAYLLEILAGKDDMDATTSPVAVEKYTLPLDKDISGITIGIPEDYFNGVDSEITEKVHEAIKEYEKMGANIKKIHLFEPKHAIAVYTILQRSEVSSNLARYDGIRYGNNRSFFKDEAKRRIMLGTYTLSAGYYDQYYNKALKVRTIIIDDFTKAFKDVDIILSPTAPTTALPVGASEDQAMFGEMADMLVEPSSIAGLPGINIPCGFDKKGLPIGLQLIGPQFSESRLSQVAHAYQKNTAWHKEEPTV